MTSPAVLPAEARFRTTGVDGVIRDFNSVGVAAQRNLKLVQSGNAAAASSFGGLSHSALIGIGELSRGIGKVAEAGEVGAFAMREFTGAAFRLGESLGPAGGLIAITLLLGHAFYEVFAGARKEMEETRKKFEDEIGKMANAGQSGGLQTELRNLLYGQPYSKNEKGETSLNPVSQFVSGAFKGSLLDLQGQRAFIDKEMVNAMGATNEYANQSMVRMLKKQTADLEEKTKPLLERRAQITAAILNVANQPASMGGMLPMVTTATKEKGMSDKDVQKSGDALFGLLSQSTLQALGVQSIGYYGQADTRIEHKGLVDASKIKPTVAQDAADTLTKTVFEPMANAVTVGIGNTLGNAISAGFDAAFAKGGNFGKAAGAFAGAALSTIGGVFKQIGEESLIGLQFMAAIKNAILSWAPAIGLAAAIGLIAFGSLLQGAGSRMSGGGGGGSYGGGGSSGASSSLPQIIDRGLINPANAAAGSSVVARAPMVFNIVGVNDPTVQRQIQEIVRKGNDRGSLG